jgi:hypothetical protein
MIPLHAMKPKEVDCTLLMKEGVKIKVTLRPYDLSDYAWLQENFPEKEDAESIAAMKPDAICRIFWHMMKPDDQKKIMQDIAVERLDEETGDIVEIKIDGHEYLLHGLDGYENIHNMLDAFTKCAGYNGFIEDQAKVGPKKKAKKARAAS